MNKNIPIVVFATLILAGCSLSPSSTTTEVVVKDGTYQADGNYTSPAGPESIGVKLTLKDGLVSDVIVEVKATHPASKKMQIAFAGGIKEQVIGKKLSDLNITKVAGSSLTGGGFNQALQKIKSEM